MLHIIKHNENAFNNANDEIIENFAIKNKEVDELVGMIWE